MGSRGKNPTKLQKTLSFLALGRWVTTHIYLYLAIYTLKAFMSTASDQAQMQSDDVSKIDRLGTVYQELKNELGKVIVGQNDVIERLAICLFARGHALLMGVPGLAKTLLISSLSETMSLDFSRIQFTPDLMPMDITGTDILQDGAGKREFEFIKGPVFANIVLAKIQSNKKAPTRCQKLSLTDLCF